MFVTRCGGHRYFLCYDAAREFVGERLCNDNIIMYISRPVVVVSLLFIIILHYKKKVDIIYNNIFYLFIIITNNTHY